MLPLTKKGLVLLPAKSRNMRTLEYRIKKNYLFMEDLRGMIK